MGILFIIVVAIFGGVFGYIFWRRGPHVMVDPYPDYIVETEDYPA